MTIEERLENVERELERVKRRDRWLLGMVLLLTLGLIFPIVLETTAFRARAQAAGPAKEIRTSSFILVDKNGATRAVLGMINDRPALALWDENGKIRAGLSVSKDGPDLGLLDENGKPRASLNLTKDGPSLALCDREGNRRFVAGIMSTETSAGMTISYPESSLILFGPDGKVIWSAIR